MDGQGPRHVLPDGTAGVRARAGGAGAADHRRCRPRPRRARGVECSFDKATTDWREIIDDPKVDIVDICTPNDMHFDVAMAAIEAGKHVYCEKPLANTVDLARQMTEAAGKAGTITLVGFNYIQNPVHGLAKAAFERGEIGDPRYMRIFFNCDFMADPNLQHSWRNDIGRAGSGMIGDVGAHCLSYFFYLLDREVEEVMCVTANVIPDRPAPLAASGFKLGAEGDRNRRIPNTTDDMATVLFRFAGGGLGHFECSRVSTGIRFDIGYDLIGTTGSLRYSYERINDIQLYREQGPVEGRGFTRIQMGPSDPRYAAMQPVSGLGLGYNDYKAIEAREMLVAVAEGRKAWPDFAFGYRVQNVVEACMQSDRERAWVRVKPTKAAA
ncbi:MAG: Gfo/Idh/MocA family oxidoreductase [Rhodospirillaceae bacterium]|nr:Gfo/Idh/MocA family oxidoreductase [Rhodospirillaceae bacterium]